MNRGMSNARRIGLVAVALASFAVADAAWAAGEGGNNIFAGDIGNVFWTVLIFSLVLFVLGKFAWGPLLETLQKREDFIHDALAQAKRDRDEAAAALANYETKIQEARAEATAIVEEGRRDADALKAKIEQLANDEAAKIKARAEREVGLARDGAVKELYALSGTLATELAGRIIEKELDPKDHTRLIEDALREIDQTGTGSAPN
ncbi:MAG: F0F1 ATP synthase subunit B [Acidobacteriota bacterium]